ncbi:MAG: MBOAT family O-acyltransferase [Bacteroidota bacterium]
MLFNSVQFFVFLPVFLFCYFLSPHRFRWMVLLAASIYFYMSWRPEYILLIFFCAFLNYFSAILIQQSVDDRRRKLILTISVILNLSVIFVFKYLGFFTGIFNTASSAAGSSLNLPMVNLLLPVGISFFTFHTMSYTIDVYRKEIPLEKHVGYFILFVVFWPMLLAGPIERGAHLIPQFRKKYRWDFDRTVSGCQRIVFGLFKKAVIADRLAPMVQTTYSQPENFGSLATFTAAVFFSIQIFCDFSGYCDIALGCAQILDFDLFENFNKPYKAGSIREFWSRWHMSLSRWFRDYVYIPLGGNRHGRLMQYRNLLITFLVSGLWHGANFTYIVWGGLHGLFQIAGSETEPAKNRFYRFSGLSRFPGLINATGILLTFLLVTFAWIFFRAQNITQALQIIAHIFRFKLNMGFKEIMLGEGLIRFTITIGLLAILLLSAFIPKKISVLSSWLLSLFFLVLLIFFGINDGNSAFIYFQF